jgi:hypothetical protein
MNRQTHHDDPDRATVNDPAPDVEHAHESDPAAYEETVVEGGRPWYFGDIAGRVNGVLLAVLLGIEALLTMRFLFLAFGASRDSGFVDFVMDVSWPFVRPFADAFADRTWDEGLIEVNTLLAMGVWLVIFALAMALVAALLPRDREHGGRYHRRRVTHY